MADSAGDPTLDNSTVTLSQPDFLSDVLQGLSAPEKFLECKYFYDQRGSELFDRICELEEYYPTRTELEITRTNLDDIATTIGSEAALLEFGSGSSLKTRLLLEHIPDLVAYLPVDVSEDYLQQTAAKLQDDFPDTEILPIVADFTQYIEVPEKLEEVRTIVYFPGSTIGNLVRPQAVALLQQIRRLCAPDGGAIIGFDLQKSKEVLELAYDDPHGVTAEFNLNILHRINRELDGTFQVDQFKHVSRYDSSEGRIEISVESLCDQSVFVAGHEFEFSEGERIATEYSHKYTLDGFAEMASEAGLVGKATWTDKRQYFALMYLTCE